LAANLLASSISCFTGKRDNSSTYVRAAVLCLVAFASFTVHDAVESGTYLVV